MAENNENLPRGIEVIVGPFILNHKDEVLLVKSPKWYDKWIICGGHVEVGETLKDSTVRETKEELGIDIEVLDIINVAEDIVSPPKFKRNAHFIYIDSVARAKSYDLKLNSEISECKWFNVDDAIQDKDVKPSCVKGLEKVKGWLARQSKS